MENATPPTPMPSAAARPSRRERETAMRETKTKLGPGLSAPTVKAAMMLRKTLVEDTLSESIGGSCMARVIVQVHSVILACSLSGK